ncbi:hypothetical protein CU254_35220 [Amycolatopsis sp. AA4]|nr:hypothetical protein CU254_35220 [Amycolatopsis sp. AA4]
MPVWQIATSSAAGSLIALIGVFAGVVATTRTQRRHWARDKLTDACRDILREATRVQRAFLHRWEGSTEPIDWVAWNQALSGLWLFGDDRLVRAAAQMDETFFLVQQAFRKGEVADLASWRRARDAMESDRLAFINCARSGALNAKLTIRTPLNSRPESDRRDPGEETSR